MTACPETLAELDALTSTDAAIDAISGTSQRTARIAHVSMTLRTGGLERLLVDFARHADRRRFDLSFIALTDAAQPAEDLRALGLPVDVLGFPKCGKLGLVRRLTDLFRERQIDLVHTHNTYAHFYATLAAWRAGVPAVINTQHGRGCGNGWKDRLQFRIANRFTNRIVGVSDDATRLCRGQDPASSARIHRIWNGIDVQRFRYTGPQLEPTAIAVGRLSPEKDFATLLRATAIVTRAIPDFRLRIVGDGAERPALERLRDELHLQDNVEFLGECSNVPELLARAGFYVASSRTEGVSLTLLEAMSVGLPVVTTSVGGNPEIVLEGETGYLAPANDPTALAEAIARMCHHIADWRHMGRTARDRIEQQFNIRTTMTHYEALYTQVLLDRKAT
jgi:glycosyltransferase involved in cell wall biosynthesis